MTAASDRFSTPGVVARAYKTGCHVRFAALKSVHNKMVLLSIREMSMSDLPKCLLIVTAEVDPAVEAEWNRWYDEVHLPDALKCPGIRRGQRYVSAGEVTEMSGGEKNKTAKRIYTTVYEIDSPEAIATPEFQAMRGWYQFTPHIRSRTQTVMQIPAA